MNEPQPQPTIPQPLPGFCIWRDERLPVLQVEFPDLSLEHLRARLKQEWGAMNGAQQSEYHLISHQQGVQSGYDASDLVCVYCMCGTADEAAVGWEPLSEQHALDFATGAYNDDAHLALNTFLRSQDNRYWFCPACASIEFNQFALLMSREAGEH